MRLIWTSVSVLGVGVGALGALWFLQGSDLVHIDPILCVGDCEPVVGHHPSWQIAGAAAVAGGHSSPRWQYVGVAHRQRQDR